ncbi:hypothetical protein Tco_0951127 [Tanacetum coccineum]|uniref:Xylulose kinase-1 n=1 Tax=Tanacetum coccineum TaxID=301880 RepID=A0ABQ5DTY4_9ASTR
MALLKYCDKHNQVGFLKKPEESAGFAEIVDFLKGSHIRYALTHNPTIYDSLVKQFWKTATVSTLTDGTLELRATIDTLEYTITKASVRRPADQAEDQPSSSEPLPSTSHPTPVAEPTPEPEAPESLYLSHPHVPKARSLIAEDLLHMVPTLITKVDSLETELKQTKNMVLTTSEDEEPEDQGRIFKDIDDDPLVSFVTPTKPSGEARSKLVDKGKRYKRRKEFKGKDFEDINTGFEEVNTGDLVNTGEDIS